MWKFKNKVLSNKIENDHSHIVYKENDCILVNKHHTYWDQIQGQLYLTKQVILFDNLDPNGDDYNAS